MKRIALTALLAITLLPVASMAQVVIRIGPPRHAVEQPGPPPQPGYVWTAGYQRWDTDHYTWVPGSYQQPPHEHAVWVAHHWSHRGGQWVLVEGHWR